MTGRSATSGWLISATGVLELLTRFGGLAAPRAGEQLVADLLAALAEQTVVVLGSAAAGKVLLRLATPWHRCWPSGGQSPPRGKGSFDAYPLPKSGPRCPASEVESQPHPARNRDGQRLPPQAIWPHMQD
ncbi:MAG TPA: hypothetical protein VN520_02655 [Streptomyces sp.]|uniref:hypothetical protein n=1 Tax=Streptomyces sp. TaxID=1931 RepID=UPI002C524BF9|nr:hypothetical protein [Streptomyces sp.]HWU05298.1 hypothetical protein [Streptomyces sp.]